MADNPVDYREYAQALIKINELIAQSSQVVTQQNIQTINTIRDLINQQTSELRNDLKNSHVSLRSTLFEQNNTIASHVKMFLDMFNKHEEKDDAVETRVTILEETIKRIKWIMGPVIVSFLAAWEAVRSKLLGK